MPELPRVQPGDAITARGFNEHRDAISDLAMGRVPTSLMQAVIAQVLATLDPERFVLVKIKNVRTFEGSLGPPVAGQSGGGRMAWWPSQVSYRVVGIGKPGIDRDELRPDYGRPVVGDECRIYPALVDMTAVLEIDVMADGSKVSRLMLLPDSEVVARKRCGAA